MSIDLNGSSDEIGLAVHATLQPQLPVSIGMWIRPDTLKTSGMYHNNKTTSQNRGIWMFLSGTGGQVEIGYGSNGGTGASARRSKVGSAGVTAAAWHYVSCSIRGATDMDLYGDGSDVGGSYSGSGGALGYQTATGGRIGSIAGASFFDGRVAELAVWTESLTAAEHLALARGASPLKVRPATLIQYIPLWTSSVIDLSPALLAATAVAGTVANHAPVGSPFPLAA